MRQGMSRSNLLMAVITGNKFVDWITKGWNKQTKSSLHVNKMTKIMVKYQNIKLLFKVGTENRPKFIHYFFDWTDFYMTAKLWLSYYIMGLSMLLSSICRFSGFMAITFVLVDLLFWILAPWSLAQKRGLDWFSGF